MNNYFIIIGLYVDDLILISNDLKFLEMHKSQLTSTFTMINNKDMSYILGIQISRNYDKKN